MSVMNVRVAALQPLAHRGIDEEMNVGDALAGIDMAADMGAQFVCFPEGYPGPSATPIRYSAEARLCAKARERGVYVIAGGLEKAEGEQQFFVALRLIDPSGDVVGLYRRTTPVGPYIYAQLPAQGVWGFDYTTGDELPVFETPYGTVGLLVCSEIYVPELARALALQGADIIFAPAGALINELLPTWRTMVWARAIENLTCTVTCQNLFGSEKGVAMIASPEAVLAQREDPGLLAATLDLDRIQWLREQDERIEMPKPYTVIPGTQRWRRPDLYRRASRHW